MKTLIITAIASLILLLPLSKPTAGLTSQSPTQKIAYAATTKLPTSTHDRVTLASSVTASTPQPAATPAQSTTVPATPQPTLSTPASYTIAADCAAYLPLVEQYNWPVATMMAIMQAESGCNPNAVSPTDDYGLMQLHDQEIFDPATNIAHAYAIYEEQGLEAWSSYNSGIYAEFL